MARLDPNPYPFPTGGYRDRFQAQSDELARLRKRTQELPDGEIEGALLAFSVADGYAYYVVTSAAPLTVAHVDAYDGYRVLPPLIKGLDREYIVAMIQMGRAVGFGC